MTVIELEIENQVDQSVTKVGRVVIKAGRSVINLLISKRPPSSVKHGEHHIARRRISVTHHSQPPCEIPATERSLTNDRMLSLAHVVTTRDRMSSVTVRSVKIGGEIMTSPVHNFRNSSASLISYRLRIAYRLVKKTFRL